MANFYVYKTPEEPRRSLFSFRGLFTVIGHFLSPVVNRVTSSRRKSFPRKEDAFRVPDDISAPKEESKKEREEKEAQKDYGYNPVSDQDLSNERQLFREEMLQRDYRSRGRPGGKGRERGVLDAIKDLWQQLRGGENYSQKDQQGQSFEQQGNLESLGDEEVGVIYTEDEPSEDQVSIRRGGNTRSDFYQALQQKIGDGLHSAFSVMQDIVKRFRLGQKLFNFLKGPISKLLPRLLPGFLKQAFSGLMSKLSGLLAKSVGGVLGKSLGSLTASVVTTAASAVVSGASAAASTIAGAVAGVLGLATCIVGCLFVILVGGTIIIMIIVMGAMKDFESTSAGAPPGSSSYVSIAKSATVDGENTLQVVGKKTLLYTITVAPKSSGTSSALTNVKIFDAFETPGLRFIDENSLALYAPNGEKFFQFPRATNAELFNKYLCNAAVTINSICFSLDSLNSTTSFKVEVNTLPNTTTGDAIANKARVEASYDPADLRKTAGAWANLILNAGPEVIIPNVPYIHEYYSLDDADKPRIQWTACGPASLTIALQYLGVTDSLSTVIRKLPADVYVPGDQTYNLPKGAEIYGKKVQFLDRSIPAIYNALKAGHPVILNVAGYNGRVGHFMVVVGIKGFGTTETKLLINDPGYDAANGAYIEYPVTGPTTLEQRQPSRGPFTNDFGSSPLAPFYIE